MDFGQKLRQLREQQGLGVNQLAMQSGVSASQISRIENGKKNVPKLETLKKLANGLHINEPDFIALAGQTDSDELNVPDWATEKDITDLNEYLETNKPMNFQGVELDVDAKEAVQQFLVGYFWKRRKQEKNDAHE